MERFTKEQKQTIEQVISLLDSVKNHNGHVHDIPAIGRTLKPLVASLPMVNGYGEVSEILSNIKQHFPQ